MTKRLDATVVAAFIGVLGAFVGGWVVNMGQQQAFDSQRAARLQDVRLATYVRFLGAAENEYRSNSELDDAKLRTAVAEVQLVSSAKVRRAARRLADASSKGVRDDDTYLDRRSAFIERAQIEANTGG